VDLPHVYALVDPRDGETFYIGKGTGDRRLQHERDARSGIVVNKAKTARILGIIAAGLSVQIAILSTHGSDDEAYAAERAAIAANPGLTNIRPGGEGGHAGIADPLRQARDLLARMVPYVDWLNETPRTNEESAAYQCVRDALHAIVALCTRQQRGAQLASA
jgi:hypothetical protein